jgi:hypothetical protein
MLGWNTTEMSRTLTGRRWTREVDVASFLALCGVIGEEREQALQLTYPHQDDGMLRLPADEQWPSYLAHAKEAVRMFEFQPFMIPWPIQTPDYYKRAFPVSSDVGLPGGLTEMRRNAVRLLELPQVDFVLHEWALRAPFDNAGLMPEQLHHLLRMSTRSSVSIRVIPIGQALHVGRYGPFTLLEFATHPTVMYREEPTTGMFLDNDREVRAYKSVTHQLSKSAFNESDSRDLISSIVGLHEGVGKVERGVS